MGSRKAKTQTTGAPEDLQIEIKQDGPKLVIKSKYQEPKTRNLSAAMGRHHDL